MQSPIQLLHSAQSPWSLSNAQPYPWSPDNLYDLLQVSLVMPFAHKVIQLQTYILTHNVYRLDNQNEYSHLDTQIRGYLIVIDL